MKNVSKEETEAKLELKEQYEEGRNTVELDLNHLSKEEYELIQGYWEASNFLSTGQIYLKENPLLLEPLSIQHIKPRLLGHFGTSVGLNFIYTHLNRMINQLDLNLLFVTGPGHGGPANVAQTYLEGSYSEIYPKISRDISGMRSLFRQFSTPGGIPSHASPNTPGSINEGGELGYCLSHAFGAVLDEPSLIAVTVVGDGEAETGPLEGSWKGIDFLNPITDGAVLPILHLNGYKISGPTVLARKDDESLNQLFTGHGYQVFFVSGDDPKQVHNRFAKTLEVAFQLISKIQKESRSSKKVSETPKWPLIILRTPKGWTGPIVIDGKQVEGTFRSHQVPLSEVKNSPEHLAILEEWLKSYNPHKHFTKEGKLVESLQKLAPKGDRRMGANPIANAGVQKALNLPDFKQYAYSVEKPATSLEPSTLKLGHFLRDIYSKNPTNFRLFCPDETNSNKLGAVFETQERCLVSKIRRNDERVSPNGRVMEVLSEHLCEGWLEGYTLTGKHGLFATYEAFALIVASMASQHAKWLDVVSSELKWRKPIPSLNILLTSTCWRNDHNGFSHQGPGFMDVILSKKASVARVYLPPDANCLLSVADHCFKSKSYINVIIIDKQPQLQYLSIEDAVQHCKDGAGTWKWAGSPNLGEEKPDIILASAGDIPTQEIVAAADWLRTHVPKLKFRVVNVVDLMSLYDFTEHPHGLGNEKFSELFGEDIHVVFAFHGYAGAIHHLLHGRHNPSRFHVRGYQENGTTTTPFMMTILNEISRFHLADLVLKWVDKSSFDTIALRNTLQREIEDNVNYAHENFQDKDEITNWRWKH
eukprot:TRINITY_DN6576_c0_g1_i1.p1 TRINITY_DN6576_c0_g1~~TRINITY_DN6576_c0_g1_i1.p1  ORF type:complete len:855 (+),score=228.10 TRINITY_DN6576_c0_g1_i1:118-2565(+)